MLKIDQLNVHYETVHAVKDVSFHLKRGEFFTLLGPSGCGKSTTLRCIAGLEVPTSGEIKLDGQALFDAANGTLIPINQRDISMVFQSYAIWPHMSVEDNVAFPLEMQGQGLKQRRNRAQEILEQVGLEQMAKRSATALSGGQQQRVALARAIAKGAGLMLLDEPLSNLDARLRVQMRSELKTLQRNLGISSLYVTHDQEEALAMSDRIAVMNGGKVIELGTPDELYHRPRYRFTGEFLGQSNVFEFKSISQNENGFLVETDFLTLQISDTSRAQGSAIMIRPERVEMFAQAPVEQLNTVNGVISHVEFLGGLVEYSVQVGEREVSVRSSAIQIYSIGQTVWLQFPAEQLILIADAPD